MPVEITHPVADASCANPRRSWIVTTAFHFVFKETDEVVFRLRGQYHFETRVSKNCINYFSNDFVLQTLLFALLR